MVSGSSGPAQFSSFKVSQGMEQIYPGPHVPRSKLVAKDSAMAQGVYEKWLVGMPDSSREGSCEVGTRL